MLQPLSASLKTLARLVTTPLQLETRECCVGVMKTYRITLIFDKAHRNCGRLVKIYLAFLRYWYSLRLTEVVVDLLRLFRTNETLESR